MTLAKGWKRLFAGIAVLLVAAGALTYYLSDKLYLRFEHTTVAPSEFEAHFSPAQLAADFQFITSQIEQIHPDVGAVVDASQYAQRKLEVLAALDRPMTRTQFYAVISTVNSCYRDGHTEILLPAEELDAYQRSGRYPPIAVALERHAVSITRGMGDLNVPADSTLVSLNGIAALALAQWMLERTSGENLSGREAYAAARFPKLAWVYGLHAPYTIIYRTDDSAPLTATSPGISSDSWRAAPGIEVGHGMNVAIANGVAILYLRDFDRPSSLYAAFLAEAFHRIRAERATSLIIDLRANNGGDSREADELQAYLSDQYLPALERVTVKTTPQVKAIYRTLLPPRFRWIPLNRLVPMLRGIDSAPDNGTFAFDPDPVAPQPRSRQRADVFHGDLYALVSAYTYSTALLFAAPLKYWHRAVIVGQPPSEPLTFFGDHYQFDAPNTRIVTTVSHKSFQLLGSHGPQSLLQPDIVVSAQSPDAMALALGEIERRRATRTPGTT